MQPDSTSTKIRPMQLSDLDQAAAIHCDLFPDAPWTFLGKGFIRRMFHWAVVSYPQLAFVAQSDQAIVGYVFGLFGGYRYFRQQVSRYAYAQALWGFLSHPGLFSRRDGVILWRSFWKDLREGGRKLPRQAEKVITAAFMGVSAPAQKKGLGNLCMGTFEQTAWGLGARTLNLYTKASYLAARRLYERRGWYITREEGENVYYALQRPDSLEPAGSSPPAAAG
ncbi:MAG: GNAT family N-acetyltransferase [Anaerolineales bacterium]|nr:GNAT family N-acetyltransferase [Anaerolineales bacterium]